ncbi:putative multidrug-efflux transporter [Pseudovibrio axinellae]|uniref:Putative multidrug-efflux transporter n=1 Tax=Pseudovibrio axinellae TaxID=989403 RepID=A0A166ATX7_9HYPH|nr:MFS transporter [Pseudovibrio axinellae]KZL21546.1 putative multidrug-efflux transporter [Pseudovibrio axinellae]SER09073.1 Predicted arabinose efflux permease, MFS family [Pseudovibrio axinellae]
MTLSTLTNTASLSPIKTLTTDGRWLASLIMVLGVGSASMNNFLSSAIMPDIIRDLGGQQRAFWVLSLFQVGSVLAGTVTGTLKARIGARPLFIAAALSFLAGSFIGGAASSLEYLLLGRMLQGLGEGMIVSLCYTLISDLYPKHAVASVFALLSGVWAVSAGIGPLTAGVLTQSWSWRAVFYANIPLALILLILAITVIPSTTRNTEATARSSDKLSMFPRLGLLAIAILLIAYVGELRSLSHIAGALFSGLFLLFVVARWDKQSAIPFIPRSAFKFSGILGLGMWVTLLLSISSAARGIYGAAMGQVLWGLTVTQASYAMAITAFTWTIAAWTVARVQTPGTQANLIRLGALSITTGILLSAASLHFLSLWIFLLSCAFVGLGFGMSSQFLKRAIIYAETEEERDRASGFIGPIQSAGITIGAAFAGLLAGLSGFSVPGAKDLITAQTASQTGPLVFLFMATIAGLATLAAFKMPRMK